MSVFEIPWARVQASLRAFLPCPECNGQGLISCGFIRNDERIDDSYLCGECHGTGTEADLTAWVPGSEVESQSQY